MFGGEDLESMTLDDLSQTLESLEKDNEQLRRENQLFDSYLKRKRYEEESMHPDNMDRSDQATEVKRQKLLREGAMLSAEHKHTIANNELETLKTNIEEGREKSETLLEKLKAILEGTDQNIAEIRKEAFDFGRFLSTSENGRTGKYDADKLVKYMDDKFRQKEAAIDKLQLKNVQLKHQIMKADQNIKQKEEVQDDLKFIDFHSLQIENKKHVKDIHERNEKLVSLKQTKGKTDQTLNSLKEKLAKAEASQKEMMSNLKTSEVKKKETKQEIGVIKNEIKLLEKEH